MRGFIVLTCLLLLFSSAPAQTFTDSNLPIVVINTDNNLEIMDSPRVWATMKIISGQDGQRNYMTDQNNPAYLNYEGRIDIEIRGSSSQFTEKKQYAFTTFMPDNLTQDNVRLLGMPSEHDWILNGMTFDPALIRDYLSYNLSRNIGEYASRTSYCEVVINGDYKGLYILQEKIKADDNRVNVTKITTDDNSIPGLTGGYITKADKTTGGDPVAWNMYSTGGAIVDFIHVLPKPEDVTPSQNNYIQSVFMALAGATFTNNSSIISGFPAIIDIPSFIDYMIISELGSNADSYMYSTFFHKDRNGKLRAGPIWDNDLTFGNDLFFWGYNRSKTDLWQLSNGDNEGARFWRDLFNNATYECYLAKRWNELKQPGQPLNIDTIKTFIDRTASTINEAAIRNNIRWQLVVDFTYEIASVKSWLETRMTWITANLGSWAQCSDVPVPPLVITKIMFHPPTSVEYPDADKLEFIEITNNGDTDVDLTGVYFGGTGFVYQFAPNSTVGPHTSIYLAGNIKTFRTKYGVNPFGQFSRNLSNKGEDLVLTDAFGNVIDNVTYSDTIPWPEADGNGKYIELADVNSDNSIGSNWIASDDVILSEPEIPVEKPQLYPNPVTDFLLIQNTTEIRSFNLYDLSGRLILSERVNEVYCEINTSALARGIYFIRITTESGTYTEKVIKE